MVKENYKINSLGIKDNVNSIKSSFQYDLSGRLVKTTDDKGNFWQYGYDENSNMNFITKKQFGISEIEGITFDKDNKITSYSNEIAGEKKVDQSIKYDGIARLFSLTTNKDANGSQILKKEYEYQEGTAANTTTTLISKEKTTVTVAGNSTTSTDKEYSYDLKGNITKIKSGDDVIKYSYDNISQLIREENEVTGEVIDYSYDTGGNILSKTVTKNGVSKVYSYEYGDANWKDKLTAFDGQTISYDAIGNPLSMGTKCFTWEQGRKLASFTDTAKGIGANYKYDENGIRKSKYVVESNKSVTKEYITSNGEVVAEKVTTNLYNSDNELTGTSTEVVSYTRGADGKLVSMTKTDMSTNNSTTYYYITNIQGDVEAMVDSDGIEVVRYSYDAYGRVTGISGSLKDSLGEMNPFRYRSYYFDDESGFYYLQSRYYSPLMGRFINGDVGLADNGNMFAYCGNNPVMNVDPTGHASVWQRAIRNIANIINNVIEKFKDNHYYNYRLERENKNTYNDDNITFRRINNSIIALPIKISVVPFSDAEVKKLNPIRFDGNPFTGIASSAGAGIAGKFATEKLGYTEKGSITAGSIITIVKGLDETVVNWNNNEYNDLISNIKDQNIGNGVIVIFIYKGDGGAKFKLAETRVITIPD